MTERVQEQAPSGTWFSPVHIGREWETRRLRDALTRFPAVVLVVGEAGIGKSRLVREILQFPEAAQRHLLLGRCHQVGEPFPLGPVIEALGGVANLGERSLNPNLWERSLNPVVGALRPLLPELSQHLPPTPEHLAEPRAERHRILRAVRELLKSLGPTVCVLEDLHWADIGTLELLSFLLREPVEQLALILTYRGEDLDARQDLLLSQASRSAGGLLSTCTIELSPLSADEVGALAATLLGSEKPSEHFASCLHARTGGLPFAVEGVVRTLQDQGKPSRVTRDSAGRELAELEVPSAVSYSVLERVARLSADARAVVRAAAVVERPAREDLLRTVAGLTAARGTRAVAEALDVGGGLFTEREPGVYVLRHALAVKAVYDDIPTPYRQQLHLRAARAFTAGGQPRPLAQIAHHFGEADCSRQWLRYTEAAADDAISVGDDRTAAELLEKALAASNLPRASGIRMVLKLGDAALFGRVPGGAIRMLGRTLEDPKLARGMRGELRLSLVRLRQLVGDTSSSHRELTQAAKELQRRPGLAARAMAQLAGLGPSGGNGSEPVVWLDRAIEASGHQNDTTVATEVQTAQALVLLHLGDPAGWGAVDELPWSADSRQQRLELIRGSKYLAEAAMDLGHYRRAGALLDRAERIKEELGHGRFAVGLSIARTWLKWRSGCWQGLEADTRQIMEATAEAPGMAAHAELLLGCLLLARGELKDAERSLGSAVNTVRCTQQLPGLAIATSELARTALARGDVESANKLCVVGLDTIRSNRPWVCVSAVAPVAVDALLAAGKAADADVVAQRLARTARGRDAPAASAALALCRGAIAEAQGRHDLAERQFARAQRTWSKLPCPYEAARARERLGGCLLVTDEDRGVDVLLCALEAFRALGASWDAARVSARVRGSGISMPYPFRGGRKRYEDELSPREAEVARLAGAGHTNREIAAVLFLSPRTVENHVASALRKLGLPSRKALASRPATAKIE